MSNVIDTTNESAYLYSYSVTDKIKNTCNSFLKSFNIKTFGYRKFFTNGKYLALCTHNDWQKFYFKNVHDVGIVFLNAIRNTPMNTFRYFLWPTDKQTDYIISALHAFNIWNGITIYLRTEEFIESFAFTGDTSDTQLQDLLINNLNNLEQFILFFKNNAYELIEHSDQTKLAKFKNQIEFEPNKKILNLEKIKCKKLINSLKIQSMHVYNLSPQEHRCTELLAQGRTMKEIGRILSISPRTVESYIENIKDKTGCNFKSQIIDLYHQNKSWIDV